MKAIQRSVERIVNTPRAEPGFMGEGHTAVEVITSAALEQTDPFVLLMDDRLDIAQRRQIGGAHPHAGLETVTLLLEGSLKDRDEGTMSAGDVLWMTAGKGIIHSEEVETEGRSRVLQLWIRLSKAERHTQPRFELVSRSGLPVRQEAGVDVLLYSGATGALKSKTLNHVPITMADIHLGAGAVLEQDLPASYNGFLYVLQGEVLTGENERALRKAQVGWLDRPEATGDSLLRLRGGSEGARVVLYAGEPQREPLIHHGPFVADDEATLAQMFRDFRAGPLHPAEASCSAQPARPDSSFFPKPEPRSTSWRSTFLHF